MLKETYVLVNMHVRTCKHACIQFNLAIPDDKQVTVELKHSLEGRLPEQDCPVCLEITMDTTDGESLVLENWCISLDPR